MMLFVEMLHQSFTVGREIELLVRVLAACICGAVIGVERSRRLKEAGVRTHVLVACTATVIMIVSKYGFADLGASASSFAGTRGADPARLAAQVVSGISFLGAGVIFKNGSTIKGLTTAAGMWATAGIGLAFGAGMYILGLFATALVVVIQVLMHKIPVGNDAYHTCRLEITVNDTDAFKQTLQAQLTQWRAQVVETRITRNDDTTTCYALTIKTDRSVTHEDLMQFMEGNQGIVSFSGSLDI
ncbi:MAG: MgtC/SapB family protein [Clostridiales bacterium]|nr:MgtC/SapB family protein [Clostridiales bacterium]MDO4349876.1 MgtC/SapB family protein [Eubacteriales bacterium]MDY4007646.1 MgtC/SapB family protein [Candidatus Limiplasma sp.]